MSRFLRLLSWLLLRPWRKNPVRQALTVVSIALGVALYLATELTLGAIGNAVRDTQKVLSAGADLTVSRGGAGITADEVARLRARPELGAVTATLQVASGPGLIVLGVEPQELGRFAGGDAERWLRESQLDLVRLATDPNALVMTKTKLARDGLKLGDSVTIPTARGSQRFTIAGALEVPPPLREALSGFAFLSLKAAQTHSGKAGKVDRADLALRAGVDLAAGKAAALACVAPGAVVTTPAQHGEDAMVAISGFRAMLVLESLLALLVALFFVYNTVSAAVADRTRDAGLLRSLGLTRAGLLALLLAEAACAGLLGLLAGIVLGFLLAKLALGLMVMSVRILYFQVPSVEDLRFEGAELLAAAGLAVGLSLLAAALAARPLVQRPALEFLRPMQSGRLQSRGLGRAAWLGALAIVLAVVLPFVNAASGSELQIGRAVALLLPGGIGLLAPFCVVVCVGWLRKALARKAPVPVLLALDATRAHPTRTAMTVAALSLSLALVIGHGGVGTSMTKTLREWLAHAIPGDVIVGAGPPSPVPNAPLEAEALDGMRELPGVVDVLRLRLVRMASGGRTFMCLAIDMQGAERRSQRTFLAGVPAEAFRSCIEGKGVIVSENLAFKAGLRVGDRWAFPALAGTVELPVVGVIRDYNSPLGSAYLDYAQYSRLFEDTLIDFGELCLSDAAKRDPAPTLAALGLLLERRGGNTLWVLEKQRFIGGAIQAVEDVNNLSFVQIVLASLIGSVGIMVTVSLSVLARRRELALVRAVGMDQRMLRATVLWEVFGLAAAAALVGLVIGNLVFLPANLVFKEFAGFRFNYAFPGWYCLLALGVAAVTALLSAIVPLRSVARLDLLEAMAEE